MGVAFVVLAVPHVDPLHGKKIYMAMDLDPEIGGYLKCARKRAKFSATLTFQPGLGTYTIITIGINKHEVVENYNFEALCGHCC